MILLRDDFRIGLFISPRVSALYFSKKYNICQNYMNILLGTFENQLPVFS